MRICPKCKISKKDEEFGMIKNSKLDKIYRNGRTCYCESCRKQYQKDKRDELRKWYIDLKSTLKCSKCGYSHPAALDFHHIEDKEKGNEIAAIISRRSKKFILKEIEKCIILCSNCHRVLHYNKKLENILP